MPSDRDKTQLGFTLIELAIVLVIMGLLAGTVVSAGDLIRASQIRSVLTQVQSFKAALSSFENQYNAWPGDMNNAETFWPGDTTNGDGDGIVSYVVGINEDLRAWEQLALSEILPGEYTGTLETGNLLVADVNIPSSRMENTGYRFTQATFDIYGKRGNNLMLGLSGYTFISGAAWESVEAWRVDRKLDDGVPTRGTIHAINGWIPSGGSSTDCVQGTLTNDNNDMTNQYTYNDGKSCTIIFYIIA